MQSTCYSMISNRDSGVIAFFNKCFADPKNEVCIGSTINVRGASNTYLPGIT